MKTAKISASALADWQEILADNGLEFEDARRNADVRKLTNTTDESRGVGLANFVELLEEAGVAFAKSSLAWGAGLTSDYRTRGMVGHAVASAKTLGMGLRRLSKYFPLIQDETSLKLNVGPELTTLSYKILDPDIWPRHEDAMYSLGLYANLIRCAAPDIWHQVEITIEADQNATKADVANIVHANVVYGGQSNNIAFPTAALDAPLELAPTAGTCLLKDLSFALAEKRRNAPMEARAREKIFEELDDGNISQDHIARELGVSSRTLRRKLAAKNLSYQDILDDCRMRVAALEFKLQKTVSISEVALKLGYSEHSTFSRAFARWAGMAPQDYRRSLVMH